MIAPLKWLKDYVEIDIPAQELAEQMIMTGNGVEGIEDLREKMQNVVVGKILKLEKHPNADKLQICQIDVGDEVLQIVTGADNVFEGALVPVAKCNSLLPNGMKIKKGKLRGVESYGMLCSGEELCLKEADYPGAEVYGILILKDDCKVGQDMRQVLMMDDVLLDFEVGANRPDCLSIIGIAREAAAALSRPVSIPKAEYEENQEDIADYVSVSVLDRDICTRYMAKAIKNVKIGESPAWMKERLKSAGVRPICNIVDITNFVMLETGQPMHAFDAADIRGGEIIVRRANEGEKITTLDGKERELAASMLMICDKQGPIGIAGVMGGENSEIKDTTQTVIFESAKFTYGNIRQTSRALGLATESSMRYSKGVDAANTAYALDRACQLVELLGCGQVVGGKVDILSEDLTPKVITTSPAEVNALLGTEISAEEMRKCLERVFIETTLEGDKLVCKIPHFRGDMDGKADVAEEVARIYGYDNIPVNDSAGRRMVLPNKTDAYAVIDILKYFIHAEGFYECCTYSFTGEAQWDKLKLPADSSYRKAVRIRNPFGDDTAYMRTTLIPDILDVMATNLKRKNKNVKIYEISKVFLPKELPLTTELPEERRKLVMAMSGEGMDFFSLKAVVENVFSAMRIEGEIDVTPGGPDYFHPGRKALMYLGDVPVGQLGEIHPDVQQNFGIPARVYVAQLDLEYLLTKVGTRIRFKMLPKYPAIERDIAIVVPRDAQSGTIRKAILKNGGRYIEQCTLFDVFVNDKLGADKKSLAYSLSFRSPEETLTEEAIAADMEHILQILSEQFGATLRE